MKALCANLGTLIQVELDENRGNYVRVRVALPVNKPLETAVAMNARLKEKRTKVEFEIQYEKFPDFCYTCGYLGHVEKSCRRKVKGDAPTGKFSGKLRCSPPRPFTRQSGTVRAKTNPTVFRGLDFSAGSSTSSGRGQGGRGARREADQARTYKTQEVHKSGNPAIDQMLAEHMQNMTGSDKEEPGVQKPTNEFSGDGHTQNQYTPSQPRSSEIIPALRDLSNEIRMANAELSDATSRGKRNAEEEVSSAAGVEQGDKAMVLYTNLHAAGDIVFSGTPKKWRTSETLEGQRAQVHGDIGDQDMMEVSNPLEAVDSGAADELTGPVEPR